MNKPTIVTLVFGVLILAAFAFLTPEQTFESSAFDQPYAEREDNKIVAIHHCDGTLSTAFLTNCAALHCEQAVFSQLADQTFQQILATEIAIDPQTDDIVIAGEIIYAPPDKPAVPFNCSMRGLEILQARVL
ncbi:MAG: hypothetical protein AAF384_19285 [Pseudomonadota bacterium]